MSTANRVIKNTMFLYIRMGASIIVSVFTTRILLQALGASDYGLYNVVAGALSMLGFLSASMSSATQRFISYAEGEGKPERIKEIFSTAVLLHWLMAGTVCLFFVLAGFIFFNGVLNIPAGRETTAMLVYGCLIFSTVFSIAVVPYDAVLNAHENMLYYSILGIADVFFKLAIAIAVSYSSWDRLLFYGILMAAESWLLRAITQAYCKKHYSECRTLNMKQYSSKATMQEMGSFAGWNMLNISTGMISLYGMNILINHFFGTLLNAAMGIANQLAGVLMGVSSNMTKAMTPILVKKEGAKDRQQMLVISYIGCKYSYLLFSVFCIPVLFFMPTILKLWLKEFPEWTILFSRLMIISCLIDQLFVFLFQSIQAQGNVKNYSILRSLINVLPIFFTFFQYKLGYGPYWVIINWIVFKVVFGGVTNLLYATKNLEMSIRNWSIEVLKPCTIVTLVSVCICEAISHIHSVNIITDILIMTLAFAICLPFYWILALNKKEKDMLLKLRTRG